MKLVSRNIVMIVVLLLAVSCKNRPGYQVTTLSSANMALDEGYKALNDNKYLNAAEYFTQVYFLNPEFPEAEKVSCLEIYSLFMAQAFGEAIDACDFMLRLYPASNKTEFIHYMKALSYYIQIEPVSLDQTNTENAKKYFSQFIIDYPKSKLTKFVQKKISIINEHLAVKEMYIGRYYLNKNDPIAAVPRFQKVLTQYSQSTKVPEALYRLIEAWMMMGIPDSAMKYGSILGYNFPDSEWYKYGYELLTRPNTPHPTRDKIIAKVGTIQQTR